MTDPCELAAGWRQRLTAGQKELTADWLVVKDGVAMLLGRAHLVDGVLQDVWQAFPALSDCALVAVGGYGRGELYPASDVDVLILLPEPHDDVDESALERLITLLWDIGLEIGHSVRNIAQCLEEAERDITIKTALLEARFLAGSRPLFDRFRQSYGECLQADSFCQAKQLEQAERYTKHNDTPYALEPNCKESPGGLRDLHIIQWVARAAGLGNDWKALARADLITISEVRQLERVEQRLRDIRIQLHLLAGRREERLLFDYQEKLAGAMDFAATATRRASEVLMQYYYKNAKLVTQLNALVMQTLADRLLPQAQTEPTIIDEHFQQVRNQLDVRSDDTFQRHPSTLLQCFLLQMQHNEIKGLTPRTLRLLWRARHRIDSDFRSDPANRALFLQLFQQNHLVLALRAMNRYDILPHYLPAFGRIVGQMQHDLFHVYTVDQHILQVIRNLRRFAMPDFAHEFPFCSRLVADFERYWLLYIAALFHDIAKGRGGDHSHLGMHDARVFCRDHGIDGADGDLVVFLVENHLVMSQVAQKQDISDPDVIRAFVDKVGDLRRLTALYLLTVADIRGTSPKVWNAWKAKLLEDLYRLTANLLRNKVEPVRIGMSERQEEARRLLRYHGLRPDVERELWSQLDTGYFIRHTAEEVAWHTRTLYYRPADATPVVRARLNPIGDGLQVMVYLPDQAQLFARLCGFFAQRGYSILDAKIHTTRHNYALDSFMIYASEHALPYRDVIAMIAHELTEQLGEQLGKPTPLPTEVRGRLSRQVRHFPIVPEISIHPDERGRHYLLSIIAADRPGLLFSVAKILGEHGIDIHTAKITTLGERAEDTFLISGAKLARGPSQVRLEQDLLAALHIGT